MILSFHHQHPHPSPPVSRHPQAHVPHHVPPANKSHGDETKKDDKHESSHLKGIDKKLASTILDELVERLVMFATY